MRSLPRLAVLHAALVIAGALAARAEAPASAEDAPAAAPGDVGSAAPAPAGDVGSAAPAAAPGDVGSAAPVTPEDAVAELARLRAGGRAGAALRRCAELARELPDAGIVHVACGELQLDLLELDAAERSFARASELQPKSAHALAMQALVLARRGDDARAGQLATTALELDPGSVQAQAVLRIVSERALVRAGTPEPAREAPAHVVWEVMELAGRGRVGDAFAAHFDRPTMRDVLRSAGLGDRGGSERALREVAEGTMAELRRGFAAYHGYRMLAAPASTGDHASVTVQLYAEQRPDLAQARQLGKLFESELRDQLLAPELVEAYQGLEPAERRAFVERVTSGGALVLATLRFELRRRDAAWKIVEVTLTADGPARSLSTLLRQQRELGEIIDEEQARRSSAYELGRSVGKVVIWLGVLAVIVWLVVASVRRGR